MLVTLRQLMSLSLFLDDSFIQTYKEIVILPSKIAKKQPILILTYQDPESITDESESDSPSANSKRSKK